MPCLIHLVCVLFDLIGKQLDADIVWVEQGLFVDLGGNFIGRDCKALLILIVDLLGFGVKKDLKSIESLVLLLKTRYLLDYSI